MVSGRCRQIASGHGHRRLRHTALHRRAAVDACRPRHLFLRPTTRGFELYSSTALAWQVAKAPPAARGDLSTSSRLVAAFAEWWHALGSVPALVACLEQEHGIPSVFLKHSAVRDQFLQHLLESPALLHELQPLLMMPPSACLGSLGETGLTARPLLCALSAFVEESFAGQLTAYKRAQRLADLKYPHEWFPATRRLQRRWKIHLGPTNSGKSHSAIRRCLAAPSAVYMSPLRLLAWEMYERMRNAGVRCALRTGQETIGPEDATHVSCTVEMAPLTVQVAVGILDEVQLIVDAVRGPAWTRALLGVQAHEFHLCGAPEPAGLLGLLQQLALDCGDEVALEECRARLAPLVCEERPLAGLEEVGTGDCVICFTRHDVLRTKAELEELGKPPCVIYGSLPPDVRREQAALFNDVSSGRNVMVASDAIGMGLNLHVRRVVFRTLRKFDGQESRQLNGAEIRQIAGRAGRYGGRYSDRGLVACMSPGDHDVVRGALTSGDSPQPSDSLRAAVFPLPEQLEAFSHAMEGETGRLLPFADIVKRFVSIAEVSPFYFVSRPNNVLCIARALTEVRLLPGEKFVFCQAPVAGRDAIALAAVYDFARAYASSGRVNFPHVEIQLEPHAITARYILELEGLHTVCDVYSWLAGRFPDAFCDVASAQRARRLLSDRIASALRQPLISHSEEEYGGLFGEELPDEGYLG